MSTTGGPSGFQHMQKAFLHTGLQELDLGSDDNFHAVGKLRAVHEYLTPENIKKFTADNFSSLEEFLRELIADTPENFKPGELLKASKNTGDNKVEISNITEKELTELENLFTNKAIGSSIEAKKNALKVILHFVKEITSDAQLARYNVKPLKPVTAPVEEDEFDAKVELETKATKEPDDDDPDDDEPKEEPPKATGHDWLFRINKSAAEARAIQALLASPRGNQNQVSVDGLVNLVMGKTGTGSAGGLSEKKTPKKSTLKGTKSEVYLANADIGTGEKPLKTINLENVKAIYQTKRIRINKEGVFVRGYATESGKTEAETWNMTAILNKEISYNVHRDVVLLTICDSAVVKPPKDLGLEISSTEVSGVAFAEALKNASIYLSENKINIDPRIPTIYLTKKGTDEKITDPDALAKPKAMEFLINTAMMALRKNLIPKFDPLTLAAIVKFKDQASNKTKYPDIVGNIDIILAVREIAITRSTIKGASTTEIINDERYVEALLKINELLPKGHEAYKEKTRREIEGYTPTATDNKMRSDSVDSKGGASHKSDDTHVSAKDNTLDSTIIDAISDSRLKAHIIGLADTKLEKYAKMYKAGLPAGAVANAILRDAEALGCKLEPTSKPKNT